MDRKTKILSGPVRVNNDDDRTERCGYQYIYLDYLMGVGDYGERKLFSTEIQTWIIFPDGTFLFLDNTDDDTKYGRIGTFDPSKYDYYVEQMKEHKIDWTMGLKYDDSQSNIPWNEWLYC